jgi:hypothetical protein
MSVEGRSVGLNSLQEIFGVGDQRQQNDAVRPTLLKFGGFNVDVLQRLEAEAVSGLLEIDRERPLTGVDGEIIRIPHIVDDSQIDD